MGSWTIFHAFAVLLATAALAQAASYYQYSNNLIRPSKYHITYQTYDKRALQKDHQGYSPKFHSYSEVLHPSPAKNYYKTFDSVSPYSKHASYGYDHSYGVPQQKYDYQSSDNGPGYYSTQYKPQLTYVLQPNSYKFQENAYAGYADTSKYPSIPKYRSADVVYGQNPRPVSHQYDPCFHLYEGDFALQAEFVGLFPGVDPQCNFVKCANYKAYVNPCSIGTKNEDDGGPHPKHGFCASLDHSHYCGQYPIAVDEY